MVRCRCRALPEIGIKVTAADQSFATRHRPARNSVAKANLLEGAGRRFDYVSVRPRDVRTEKASSNSDTQHALSRRDLQRRSGCATRPKRGVQRRQRHDHGLRTDGSGTTPVSFFGFYAVFRDIDVAGENVVTIEDRRKSDRWRPRFPQRATGPTPWGHLRCVLRQDPTPSRRRSARPRNRRIAPAGGLTAHSSSTVHSNDPSARSSLPISVLETVLLHRPPMVLRQPRCENSAPPARSPQRRPQTTHAPWAKSGEAYKKNLLPRGCPQCVAHRLHGQAAFFELLSVTAEMGSDHEGRPVSRTSRSPCFQLKFVNLVSRVICG